MAAALAGFSWITRSEYVINQITGQVRGLQTQPEYYKLQSNNV